MTHSERDAQRAAADERWQSSAAYADMRAALTAHGWTDYADAIVGRHVYPARWQAFQLEWERRMQARVGIVVRPASEREAPDSRTTTAFNRRAGRARHHRAAQ